MIEHRQIVDLASRQSSSDGVLVTLVRVEGSSYRRPGAKLLTSGGDRAGMISGGCLEFEVVKKAKWAVRLGAVLERYSTLHQRRAMADTRHFAAELLQRREPLPGLSVRPMQVDALAGRQFGDSPPFRRATVHQWAGSH